jgi:hypothetical protein
MLRDVELFALDRFALIDHRKALAVFILRVIVAAFLIDREKAVKLYDLAGGAQFERARAGLGVMSTVVRSSSADSIWLATVRIQISS